jgi:hypothetical protein
MTSRPRAVKKAPFQPVTERRDFTFRPDDATWKRLVRYCRAIEDEEGKLPSKNALLLEALNEWLDRNERKR